MKTNALWSICILVILSAIVSGCFRDPIPESQSINEPFDSDPNRDYRITAIAISELPAKNIKIDQQKREIAIDLPADFVSDKLEATVTLTPNTTLVSGLGSTSAFGLESFCYCNAPAIALIKPTGSAANRLVSYSIRVKASAPLTLQSPHTPLSVSLSQFTSIALPVVNPYGNSPVVRAYLQPLTGGDPVLVQGNQAGDSGCVFFACDPKQPGRLVFNLNLSTATTGAPGDYNLHLEQQNGNRLTQRIRILRGTLGIDVNRFFGYTVSKGAESFAVNGSNLFADEITGVLTGTDGRTWNVKPISSAPNGTTLVMGIPNQLEPGYYTLQLKQNNAPYSDCFRLSVRQSDAHPVLMAINVDGGCLKNSPAIVRRTMSHSVAFLGSTTAQLKLSSIADPTKTYLIPITYPIESFPKFVVPDTVSPGSYQAVIQTMGTAVTLESEPFEQPVLVQ